VARYCHENLTGYKRPKYIEFRDELPKTNVGKILRRELRQLSGCAAPSLQRCAEGDTASAAGRPLRGGRWCEPRPWQPPRALFDRL
jgi:hypothetical protein